MKVILTSNQEVLNEDVFSIECGKNDGKKHFDHHGEFENEKCVAIATLGKRIPKDSTIIVSHLDADALIALANLLGKEIIKHRPMLDDIAQADINGSHTVEKADAYFYNTGLKSLMRDLRVPRVTEELIDITKIVKKLINSSVSELIEKGREEYKKVAKILEDATVDKKNKTIFLELDQLADVTLLYSDEINKIVVFRSNWKTISLYSSSRDIIGTYSKVKFGGHPKACGSPRGEVMTRERAKDIFDIISQEYCHECGRDLEVSDKYCPECGTDVID